MAIDWNKLFAIKNVSNGIVTIGALMLNHENEKLIDPSKYSAGALERIKLFTERGFLETTNDTEVLEKFEEYGKIISARDAETAEGYAHVVFDPESKKEQFKPKRMGVIETTSIETGKAMEVKAIDTSRKATGKVEETFDIEEAKGLLNLHWKTLEKKVAELTNEENLEYILTIAKNMELGDKKIEIIEARLAELKA